MTPELIAFLQTYGIPALAFLIGHLQVLAPLVNKIPLLTPKKPTDPVIRPFGQGGLIDVLTLLAQVATHPATTPDQKTAALNALNQLAAAK